MNNIFDNRDRDKLDELYKRPSNKKLKTAAVVMIAVGIGLLLLTTFCIDLMSWTTVMMMRGLVGLCAIAFIVLTGILVYRVNNSYLEENHRRDGR